MSQSIMDNRSGDDSAPVAHPRDSFEAMAEIAFHINNLGYTDEEWRDHDFYSPWVRTMKRIYEIVKETGN